MSSSSSSVAFAFDIDGVLVKGKTPIPGAQETLKFLQDNDIPFIFLTNSGGVTEKENIDRLALRLGDIEFDERQIVQSHTPFKDLVPQYHDKPILVLGGVGDNIRKVAHAYGFKKVLTSSDLYVDNPAVHPFPEMSRAHHEQYGRKAAPGEDRNIAAIMIWSSPRDWCLDLSLIIDHLQTQRTKGGVLPKLYGCNPDVEWATTYPHPRLAQGAFIEALRGICANRGIPLAYDICGKPRATTYDYAENTMRALFDANDSIKTVWMIGDNVESDIAGAMSFKSRFGYTWHSVLVESGVYQTGTEPAIHPTSIATDVRAAVQWALDNTPEEA